MAAAAVAALCLAATPACRRGAADPLLTYYHADQALSLRHPRSWRTEQAQQPDGSWYRYFLAPAHGPERKPAVSVTLVALPLSGGLDAHAGPYLSGQNVTATRAEERSGARGKTWDYASPDRAMRGRLLLVQEENRVYGLHAQGSREGFAAHEKATDALFGSFTLERWARYPEETNTEHRFALRVPPTWKDTRTFSGGGSFTRQFTSPALGADKEGGTIHAFLTVSVEPAPGGLEAFYRAATQRLGEAYQVLSHSTWKDGFVDLTYSETQVSTVRGKRYYRVVEGRGYTLAFEARDDVYPRVSRWCDMIAATFEAGPEIDAR